MAWLCNASVWSRSLKSQDLFVKLVMEMEAWNIPQQYVCHFCVLNSVTVPQQHMEKFNRPLEIMQCQQQDLHWHKIFSKGRTLVEDE